MTPVKYPYTVCDLCKVLKKTEDIFKSLETGKEICFNCLRTYDLMIILNFQDFNEKKLRKLLGK